MRLNKIKQTEFHADWDTYVNAMGFRYLEDCPDDLCEATGVHQRINLERTPVLNEATYKEIALLIDGNFLNQKIRADALNGIRLEGFDENIMRYRVNSAEFQDNRIQYECSVLFENWDDVGQDQDFNFAEKARLLLWVGDIQLHCTCPSFLYWGYQYLLTAIDAAIYPEKRPPNERNPSQRGIVCKHLNRILRVLPFYSGDIAAELKRQYGST